VFLQRRRQQAREDEVLARLPRADAEDDPTERFWNAEGTAILYQRALQIVHHDFDGTTVRAALAMILESRPAQEIAAETGMSRAAVYAAKARVLARLRDELGEWFD
jgi:RNA polymerase sigma-70 factor (ECF subfamily)